MQHFAKPENALKRADELCAVNQKESALVALHDVLSSKRHRTWQPAIEEVIMRYLDLCVELRKGKAAKEGLIQYRIICQQVNVGSMETVLRHFMSLAEEATRAALEKAEKLIGERVESMLDFDDLEAEETPESLMMATIGGSADSKKRTDRQVVTPTLKFLWESFRTVLDILRNNTKLEELYRDAAANAFGFCLKYKRSVEFRRLCEILRNHITSQTKFDPKWKDREPPTPESLQIHLDTRFSQLSTAIELELWQEAYRTVEDVHLLLQQMKKPPRASSMAAYHAQLATIFWVADNKLFHAYALSMLFLTTKSLKNAKPPAEMQELASRAVLSALSVAPASPVLDVNLLEYDLEHEKTKRMAQMLAFPASASRAALLSELAAKGVVDAAAPEVVELYRLVEKAAVPLDLAERSQPLLAKLAEAESLTQYGSWLRRLIALRMLQQMQRVYVTIHIEHVKKVMKGLLSWPEIEALIIFATKRELLALRIDYKLGRLNQQPSASDAAISTEVRDSLFQFAAAMDAVAEQLRAPDIQRRKAEVRTALYSELEAGMSEEHEKILSRRLIIERRKEEAERVSMEGEKERLRLKSIAQQKELKEEKERLATEARRRDREREERERKEEDAAQMRKLAEQMAEQRKAMKVTKKKGEKAETNVDKLVEKDRNELMREQRALMLDERTEFEKRLESMGKRHDHLERARREEERPLLLSAWEEQQTEDRRSHEEQQKTDAQQMRETRAHGLQEKSRFLRMAAYAAAFEGRVLDGRREAHVGVLAVWREEQQRIREAVRLAREMQEEEERAKEALIEDARREAEEEEARRILEAQEAERKAKEEEEERKRVAERQKAKERELEEKAKETQRLAALERETAKLREREQKGTSWAVEDDDDELPKIADGPARPAQPGTDASARPRTFGERRPDRPPAEEGWQTHSMGRGPRPAADAPDRGGDRWERAGPRRDNFGDRDRPPPRDFGDRGPPRDFGDRGPSRRDMGDRDRGPPRDFGDRGPPRDFGDRGPPRDFGDRGPSRRDMGDRDRGPPRDFGDRGQPRDFGDRGPPRRDMGDRDRPPPRDFGDRGRDGPPPRRDDPPRSEGRSDGRWR